MPHDTLHFAPPTEAEIAEARANALAASHPPSWAWDELLTSYVPPFLPPHSGLPYLWDESLLSWVPFPDYPMQPPIQPVFP